MGSPSNEDLPHGSITPSDSKLPTDNEGDLEQVNDKKKYKRNDGYRNHNVDIVDEDEDEEEDVDFNPFLKDSPSLEASSSLSSEGLDADIVDSGVHSSEAKLLSCLVRDIEPGKEIETQTTLLPNLGYSAGVETCPGEGEEGKFECTSQPDSQALHEISFMNMDDDDDAICKRTRARYSLAKFTLDELETFLQETDDEDDIHNVDDEEEYRKFLAAVLLGGDGDSQDQEGNKIVDEEDDDNDADFELEIEEALESDIEENTKYEYGDSEDKAVGRRHKSRRNRLRQSTVQHSNKTLPASSRPLRPLIPIMPIKNFSAFNVRELMPKEGPQCPTFTSGFINGFTPHQIGQLHSLIHEHVQLLIQVFSICALDPTRRQIAFNVQSLIQEMLSKRDQVLDGKRIKQSSFYSAAPYGHPIVPGGHLSQSPSTDNMVPFNGMEGPCLAPYATGPLLSVMDVAPLSLAQKYLDDVSTAIRARQRLELGFVDDTCYEREPLFPLTCSSQSSLETDLMPKRTMAAALVEKAKKQSIVSVPKEIAKLASRFYPLFNPSLYPHERPAASVVNRVLFTDSEDELLALGMMEFNTDWKAIQQCFLPCKKIHQIFVRQKNRSSSKSPENPIKAVRRMKNSPLTAEEIARIEEGLKVFKLDWMTVWKFIVPYRDPTLLPRQWRIAHGTQKSYKVDEAKKEKRRLSESRKRERKSATLAGVHISSDKEQDHVIDYTGEGNNSGENHSDREDEAYVHEAFLADWRPGTSSIPRSVSGHGAAMHSTNPSQHRDYQVGEQTNRGFGVASASTLRSSICQPPLRPYRDRKRNNAHLVKLAPGLPPVNLPPTARIITQSAHINYQAEGSKTNVCADRHIVGDTFRTASILTPVVIDPIEVGQKKNKVGETNSSYDNPHASGGAKNKSGTEENDNSSFQMHPLLFQASEAGQQRCPPLHGGTSTSTCSSMSTFSFSSGREHQLNLSLFPNFRGARHTVNLLDKYLRCNEIESSSGIDFHPLLQKDNKVNCELTNLHSASHLGASPELLRGGSSKSQYPCVSSSNKSYIKGSPCRPSPNPSSPYEKSNEIDLDIHLSFTPGKRRVARRRDQTNSRTTTSVATSLNFGAAEPRNEETLSNQHALASHTADQLLLLLNNNENRSNLGPIVDDALPGIVMEQEELSDSEEELGENVEFECEEMTDSEREEASDSDEKRNLQNEVQSP
ncbi:hypothetical protein Leryth_014515 [Lithospermum erythrorhizon]|nr:hypothetical protein Leryth_014515 [Lithospermum erythrorhizon]